MFEFYQKLQPNDLVALVNEAISFINQNNPTFLFDIAQNVIVYDDKGGGDKEEFKHLKGISPVGTYHVFGDFYLNDLVFLFKGEETIECSLVLHSYMLKKFGDEYEAFLHDVGKNIPENVSR